MYEVKKYQLLSMVCLIIILVTDISFQDLFAFGITVYSPNWMDEENNFKVPYFEYCKVFDSCLNRLIRINPFFPLTSQAPDLVENSISAENSLPPDIPFELPFP